MTGRVVHDPHCKEPINEHTGTEPCLQYLEDKDEKPTPVAHYKQGPQGNVVADYYADYLARRHHIDPDRVLGHPEITDRRDNSDPAYVGEKVLSLRESMRDRNGSKPHDSEIHIDPKQWHGH